MSCVILAEDGLSQVVSDIAEAQMEELTELTPAAT